jgi:arsenate reductase
MQRSNKPTSRSFGRQTLTRATNEGDTHLKAITNEKKKKVLLICTHNSGRSQMAKGYLRAARCGNRFQAFSAGTEPAPVHPTAIQVMKEIGIDISPYRPKHLKEFIGEEMDLAVTVCDSAYAACPMFPWTKVTVHAEFLNPSAVKGSDEEILPAFRTVRDALITRIQGRFPEYSEEDR